ncbi:MAG TPA: hypothetical protein VGE72_29900 [Azospirillum sp.]
MTSSTAERRRGALALFAALAGAAVLPGCAPAPRVQCDFTPLTMGEEVLPAGPVLVAPTPGTMRPVPLDTVSILDGGLRSRVMVQSVTAGRTAVGNVEVGARLMNCTDTPMPVQGRTQFLDEAQRPAEPPSAWQRLHLPPRSFVSYGEVSVAGPRAASFLIEVRRAD